MAHIPQSVCNRVERLMRVHDQLTVAKIVGISPNTIRRMRDRGWVAVKSGGKFRPRPTDFAFHAKEHINDLAKRYRTSTTSITRWRRELRG